MRAQKREGASERVVREQARVSRRASGETLTAAVNEQALRTALYLARARGAHGSQPGKSDDQHFF